jgi:hypothetical protein
MPTRWRWPLLNSWETARVLGTWNRPLQIILDDALARVGSKIALRDQSLTDDVSLMGIRSSATNTGP